MMLLKTLNPTECRDVLAASRVGHLACCCGDRPYVVPIHYAFEDGSLYVFSMPGKKIEWMRQNARVSLVVEERGRARGWRSVVVDGTFEELPDRIGFKRQRDHAWSLLSRHANWWEPGALKPVAAPESEQFPQVFFRIRIEETSGREATE